MKKLIYVLAGILCLAGAIFLAWKSIPDKAPEKPALVKEATAAVADRGATQQPEAEQGYVSPIDFAALEAMNEDIYAWLYIPGTDINHPVLQSVRGDNDYYLTHTVDRQEDENGCLFTEYLYSDKDFRVPVTVIYGHRRRSGDMFGQLQTLYAVTGSLEQYSEVIIYLPDRELHYQVFGESEFSDMHIPNHFKRFHNKADILTFLEELKRYHTMTKQFDESVSVTEDDKILILSTCLAQNDDQRFLVLAKLIEEIS